MGFGGLHNFYRLEQFRYIAVSDSTTDILVPISARVLDTHSVRVTFSQCVDINATTGIQVNIDGAGWETVAAVASGSQKIWVFTTTTAVAEGDTVLWQYLGAVNSIVDCVEAVDVGPLGPKAVTNGLDLTAPTLQSVEVGTVANNVFVLVFSEDVASTGFATGWSIAANATPLTVMGAVESSAGTIQITTTESVYIGQTVTISYNSGPGDITDISIYPSPNALASITNRSVTNNSTIATETTAPTLSTVEVGTLNDSTFVLTFSEEVTASNFALGWTLTADAVGLTINGSSQVSPTVIRLTVAEDVYTGQTVLASYSSATGDITDVSGVPVLNDLASITNRAVTNNSATESPVTQPYQGIYRYETYGSLDLLVAGPFISLQTLIDAQVYTAVTTSTTVFGAV